MIKNKRFAFLIIFFIAGCSGCIKDFQSSTKTSKTQVSSISSTSTSVVGGSISSDFFLSNWAAKKFTSPAFVVAAKPTGMASTVISVNTSTVISEISNNLGGSNANTFSGQMTDANLVANVKGLNPGLIRYPGGNISDTYFWNEPNGQLPADVPPSVYVSNGDSTTNYFWYGQNTQSWTLSLNNYYALLQNTGSKGVITVNYSYARYGTSTNPVAAAAHLAANWVRYDKGRTTYWEVGNENYGYWEPGWKINTATNKDGQPMQLTGTLYGKHFLVFADSMRKAAAEIGVSIKIGAQLIAETSAATQALNPAEANWNSGLLASVGNQADYYIVHDYYTSASDAASILNSATAVTQNVKTYIQQSITSSGAQQKPIAMTEWNIFSVGSDQKVSQIAGIHAVITQGEMIKAGINMATRFDLLGKWDNGDDFGTFSIGDEPDNPTLWNPRPAFYFMYYFKSFVGDQLVSSSVNGNSNILAYASKYSTGNATGVVVVNKGSSNQYVTINIANNSATYYYYYTLVGDNSMQFSRKVYVNGQGPSTASGGPSNYASIPANRVATAGGISVSVPAYSVVYLVAQ